MVRYCEGRALNTFFKIIKKFSSQQRLIMSRFHTHKISINAMLAIFPKIPILLCVCYYNGYHFTYGMLQLI